MSRDTFEEWIADENDSQVIHKLMENSAVEALGQQVPMSTSVKNVPRDGGFQVTNVAKAGTYQESSSTDDTVEMIARKAGGIERVAVEDLVDPFVGDVLAEKRPEAARALAINYDNSCLAVTAAGNGTTVKYNSVYYTLTHNDNSGSQAYAANDNYRSVTAANFVATLASGTGYDKLNDAVGAYEEGDFFDEGDTIIIASPRFRKLLRGVKDADGNPMLVPRAGSGLARPQYDIFGYPTFWSKGARTSAVDSQSPQGNPLLVIANRRYLINGRAALPGLPVGAVGFQLQLPSNGIGFATDEAFMKAAFRRGFVLTVPNAAACLEILP